MNVFKGVVAAFDIFFFIAFLAFMMTIEKEEIKSNPIATAFFLTLISCFAANAFLIFTM